MARVEQAFFDRTQSMNNYGNYVTADVPYFVFDALDEDDAVLAVHGYSSEWFGGLRRDAVEVEERINEDTFKVIVRYQQHNTTDDGDDPETVYTFDTGGGTQHITQSLKTVARYSPPDSVAPDFKSAIGATGESVEGVDVTVPVYNFSETHYIATAQVTGAYKAALFYLTGKVNSAAFRGFAAGEVLFLGASGSKRGEEDWEITFRFAASQNVNGLAVGDILGINKKGWEYLWVRYADDEDQAAKVLVKKPIGVYIEKVYEEGNFAGLGIGT